MSVTPTRLTPPSTSYWSIIKLSAPIWVSNLAIVGGSSIDTLMAGHLGPTDLAGVAIGIAVSISIFVGLVGIMQGLSPIAAHHLGAGKHEKIGPELHQTLWIAVFLSIIGVLVMTYTPLWMTLTNAQGETAKIASLYLIINAIGLPGAMAGRAYLALNAAVSRPKIAMWISLLMLALKAPFNALFMYGWGPIPALGGAGCAVSSALTSWITLLLFWGIWHFDSFYVRMRSETFSLPNWKIMAAQLKLGIPIGLSAFFEVTSFTFMTIFISRLGEVTVSGHQIVANLTSLFYMLPLSIGVTASVLVSQSLGAGSAESARRATFNCLKFGICCAVVVSLILYFFKYFFVELYTDNASVIAISALLIPFAAFYHIFDATNCIGSFAMRGYRITFAPMVLYGVLLWGIGLGLGSLLTFTDTLTAAPLGARGYWSAITIGLTISGIVVGFLAVMVANNTVKGKKVWLK